jgi:molecular chaperone Hsp33
MDGLLRAINEPESIRVVAAITSDAVREACRRQGATWASAMVLGRALTSGVLLATLAKGERERVRVQVAGGGAVGQVVIDAHGDGRVRACLSSPLAADAALNRVHEGDARPSVAPLVGARGHLTVTRDLGLARPYQGSVELRSGEIDEDLEHYLQRSEQLPSALRVEVVLDTEGQVLRAAGVLVQSFPGEDPSSIDAVRERLVGLRELLVGHQRELGELVGLALGGEGFRRMVEHGVEFHCPCGPARARSVLATLGAADLDALAGEQDETEVRCNFCGQVTILDAAQLRGLADELRRGRS